MHGTFENHMPQVSIKLLGIDGKTGVILLAIIDTGFNGYLQVPAGIGLPIGLKTVGVTPSTLADGSPVVSLTCEGFVELCGQTLETVVNLPNNGAVLIGTQLLKKLGKDLIIDFENGSFDFKNKETIKTPKSTKKV